MGHQSQNPVRSGWTQSRPFLIRLSLMREPKQIVQGLDFLITQRCDRLMKRCQWKTWWHRCRADENEAIVSARLTHLVSITSVNNGHFAGFDFFSLFPLVKGVEGCRMVRWGHFSLGLGRVEHFSLFFDHFGAPLFGHPVDLRGRIVFHDASPDRQLNPNVWFASWCRSWLR